jgi:hypothetical protein
LIFAADRSKRRPSKKENPMPTMSNQRRKRIQARQRKARNAEKREAKAVKRERNAKPAA